MLPHNQKNNDGEQQDKGRVHLPTVSEISFLLGICDPFGGRFFCFLVFVILCQEGTSILRNLKADKSFLNERLRRKRTGYPTTIFAEKPPLANRTRVKGLAIYIAQASYDNFPPTGVGVASYGE
jgi:hypothetical protein